MSREVGTIVNLYRWYENEYLNSEYLKEADLSEVFKFMMGMTYEQFKYQNIAWPIQNPSFITEEMAKRFFQCFGEEKMFMPRMLEQIKKYRTDKEKVDDWSRWIKWS